MSALMCKKLHHYLLIYESFTFCGVLGRMAIPRNAKRTFCLTAAKGANGREVSPVWNKRCDIKLFMRLFWEIVRTRPLPVWAAVPLCERTGDCDGPFQVDNQD